MTLTPAAATNKRNGSHSHDNVKNGCRRRFGSVVPRHSDRGGGSPDHPLPWQRKQQQVQERRRLRLEDWFLAVQLLLNWDDQKTISAEHMEQFLERFLQNDAKSKHRITPRLTSEIFLRGILRTLWDIDRLLQLANPGDELKRFTANSPLLLSILRVMTYEFMWMPTGTVRMAQQSATDLIEKCKTVGKSDRDWILVSVGRMRNSFEQTHQDWERKRTAREERKRREREENASGGALVGVPPVGLLAVPAARPKGAAAVLAAQPKRRTTVPPAVPAPRPEARRPVALAAAVPLAASAKEAAGALTRSTLLPRAAGATSSVPTAESKGTVGRESGKEAAVGLCSAVPSNQDGDDEEQDAEEEEEEEQEEEEEEVVPAEADEVAEEEEEEHDQVDVEEEEEEEEDREVEDEEEEEEDEAEGNAKGEEEHSMHSRANYATEIESALTAGTEDP